MVIWIPTEQVQYGIKSSKWRKIRLGVGKYRLFYPFSN